MSRQSQDVDPWQNRSRPRANTTSFTVPFAWRRQRTEHPVPPVPQQPLPLEALIEALTPPAVPSLAHARMLASTLSTASPLPRREVFNPILTWLCDVQKPVAIQAAGYDILSAYCENNEALPLTTNERLFYFSLFPELGLAWGMELWEPRFKALRAVTKYGEDVWGIETNLIDTLKRWIKGAFDGLLQNDSAIERTERAERERSIDVLVQFLADILQKPENISRIPEDVAADVLQFYADLVNRSVILPLGPTAQDRILAPAVVPNPPSNNNTPSKTLHKRNTSSLSISSIPSAHSAPKPPPLKHPGELAISLYLSYLSSQLKSLSPEYLQDIHPVLFRALAFSASPLPRLTVLPRPHKESSREEEKITEILNALLAGPYTTICMRILKRHLFPPNASEIINEPFPRRSPEGLSEGACQQLDIMTSLGAHRMLRNFIRRALSTRLARAYIQRESSISYSHTGAPGHIELEPDLMERAWPKDDYASSAGGNGWDAGRLGKVLASSVHAWVAWGSDILRSRGEEDRYQSWEKQREGQDTILEEAAGVLKDILQEMDSREDDVMGLDEEEAIVVGETLQNLAGYVLLLKNPDGSPYIVPIANPSDAPTPLLRTITSLLARDHSRALIPLLSNILVHIANNLTDADTARLPALMMEQQDLSPTSPEWLDNWKRLLCDSNLVTADRPATRRAVIDMLYSVYDNVRDMKSYRRPLADLVFTFCSSLPPSDDGSEGDATWKILGDEIVLRTVEQDTEEVPKYIDLLVSVASANTDDDDNDVAEDASVHTAEQSTSPPISSASSSTIISPIFSRMQSDFQGVPKEKEPGFMSMLSSLTTGGSTSRSQSIHPSVPDDPTEHSKSRPRPECPSIPRVVCAVSAFIEAFSQLTFTPFSLKQENLRVSLRIFEILVKLLSEGKSTPARLTVLQFLMRLRVDRDHRLYFMDSGYDSNTLLVSLCSLVNRVRDRSTRPIITSEDVSEVRKARPRVPHERDGRQPSKGKAAAPSHSKASRSRSRATVPPLATPTPKLPDPIWHIPETLPFKVVGPDAPSEGLISYDPEGIGLRLVLPISIYLQALTSILEKEQSWEVLSYILCNLPVQLANTHIFCGPNCRAAISKLQSVLCAKILDEDLGSRVKGSTTVLKRDAQGLAHHILSVLVSYRRCFDKKQQHLLVETFYTGLNGQLSTIKCCLHALSLSAFELPPSMTKFLSRILEKLSQIMSNPEMAVHILGFLSIIGSLPSLYANFTEADFKMVFGVALQYLQHYNRLHASPTMSWALSQHVRILSYSVVYAWFLAVKIPDRPRHVAYITRQLLLANEGNTQVDGPTEVCFDWLARYTYASADPRPATSSFSDLIMDPSGTQSEMAEKTWIMGNSVVTVRAIAHSGWVEVMSRRPSGYSRFICRVENVPMVGAGDVAPDLLSIPAGLVMERETGTSQDDIRQFLTVEQDEADVKPPDSITGYVWSGTAPSQRRKQVTVDPSYLILQLSPFPDGSLKTHLKRVTDTSSLKKFLASLDRMPVIDTHKVGIMYVGPGQRDEVDILRNSHGSPAYTRFLEGIGRLINLRGQVDVYAGGLDPEEDGEYAYAWWDDIGQILYHTATLMPNNPTDPQSNNKKRHIGNDYVRIVWNDSGIPYRFDTLTTQFQFVNIVVDPHSLGAIAAFSNNLHETEYFKVTVQSAPGMPEFAPLGHFKLISAENLPLLVRQLSLLADWFASVFAHTQHDTIRVEMKTNWHNRLDAIIRFKNNMPKEEPGECVEGIMGQEAFRDFTTSM